MKDRTGTGPKRLEHEFPPFFNDDSGMLFLGSFPSVRSRQQQFYYGHPQNRFWKILTLLYADPAEVPAWETLADPGTAAKILEKLGCPKTREEKAAFAQTHRIALWDVIDSCVITGSSDASIRDAAVNDLSLILPHSRVRKIFINGSTAGKLFRKYMLSDALSLGLSEEDCVILPSTSPANAAWTLPRLLEAWQIIRK